MATSLTGPRLTDRAFCGGAGAPPAGADQGHLDHVAAGGVDPRDGNVGQGRSRSDLAGGLDEFTTCRLSLGGIVHGSDLSSLDLGTDDGNSNSPQ